MGKENRMLAEISKKFGKYLKLAAHPDERVALRAQRLITTAFTTPLRQGILEGDEISGIFESLPFTAGVPVEYPLDFFVPGTEDEYVAYVLPFTGRLPEKQVEGDYLTVTTYPVGASIDWPLRYARNGRWDIQGRAMLVLEHMFQRKLNRDGWQLIIAVGTDRNVIVADSNAPSGYFTKKLVAQMQTSMKRQGGGTTNSLNRISLTDLFTSPEAMEDIRSWDLTQVDDVTRREIYLRTDGSLSSIFGVTLHELNELGENQAYQTYFTGLGGSLGSDVELVVGLNLKPSPLGASFVMPVIDNIEVFPDPQLHRQQRQGVYAWREHGLAVLDNRHIIFGTF